MYQFGSAMILIDFDWIVSMFETNYSTHIEK